VDWFAIDSNRFLGYRDYLFARNDGELSLFTLLNSSIKRGLLHSILASSSSIDLILTGKTFMLVRKLCISRSFYVAVSGTYIFF